MTVQFTATLAEDQTVTLIIERVRRECPRFAADPLVLHMDLVATHANGCPLDFAALLAFPVADFVHDVAGITRHLDRSTGELLDCFLPRCARPSGWIDAVGAASELTT